MRIIAVILVGALVVGLAAAQKVESDYDDDYDYDNETPVKDTPVKDSSAKKDTVAKDTKTKQAAKGAATVAVADEDDNEDAPKKKPDNPTSIFLKPRNTRNKITPAPLQRPKPTLPPFVKPTTGAGPPSTIGPRTTKARPTANARTTTTTTKKPKRGGSSPSSSSSSLNNNKKNSRTTETPAKETGRRFGGSSNKPNNSKSSRYNRDN
ncbi:histone deacetylase HDT2-like [Varroa jacobsoni]|nr:histone deacetylase HDT2-like [Varroa jacobsoni]